MATQNPMLNLTCFLDRNRSRLIQPCLFAIFWCFFHTGNADEFMAISDIHFDPYVTCENQAKPCPIIKKLIQEPAEKWNAVFAQYAQYNKIPLATSHQETHFLLLQSALNFSQNLYPHQPESPQFIALGGDYLGHHYQEKYKNYSQDNSQAGYENFVKKTIQFLIQNIHQTFPHTPIIPAIGNNDSYSGDYISDPNGAYFHDMGLIFLPLLPKTNSAEKFTQTFDQGGYYAINISDMPANINNSPNKIIVLNSVLFSNLAKADPHSNPGSLNKLSHEELSWLNQQLINAEKNHDKIWILMHIPDVIDDYTSRKLGWTVPLWDPEFDQEFLKIIHNHAGVIQHIFSGHFHRKGSFSYITDSSKILDSYIPGMDSTHGNNPSFQVYKFDSKNFQITGISTYELKPLGESGGTNLKWQKT